jgi:hypothetical protein
MTHETMRIEGQILAYASRQRHAEDLLERARVHVGDAQEHAEVRSQLDGLGEEHSRLSTALDRLKGRDPSESSPCFSSMTSAGKVYRSVCSDRGRRLSRVS